MITVVLGLVVTASVGWQLVTGWTSGRWAVRDRHQIVSGTVGTWLLLMIVRAVHTFGPATSWLWTLAVVATAVATAGTLRRWSDLPWSASRPVSSPGVTPPRPASPVRHRLAQVGAGVWLALGILATVVLI